METPNLKPVPADDDMQDTVAEEEDREPTKEELLEDLRVALRDAIAGKDEVPAREFLEELIRERDSDSDQETVDS